MAVAFGRRRIRPLAFYGRSADLTEQAHGIARDAVNRLDALPRPTRDRLLARYLALAGARADLLGQQAKALRHHDPTRIGKLNLQAVRLTVRVNKVARRYGFKVCGRTG